MTSSNDNEVTKLNNFLREAFVDKPHSFWHQRDPEGNWFYYGRVERYLGNKNHEDDPSGFTYDYYCVLNDEYEYEIDIKEYLNTMWSGENMYPYVENHCDSEWLGETFEEAQAHLKKLIGEAEKRQHIYE